MGSIEQFQTVNLGRRQFGERPRGVVCGGAEEAMPALGIGVGWWSHGRVFRARHGAANSLHMSKRERATTRNQRIPYQSAKTAITANSQRPYRRPTTSAAVPAPSQTRARTNATIRLTPVTLR